MGDLLNLEAMKNLASYNNEMAKSSYDKLGFVDKIFDNIDVIVDFGCADGSITELFKLYYPNAQIIGYDIIKFPKDRNKGTILYTNDLNEVAKRLKGNTLLVFNTVLHEVFHYMSYKDAHALIDRLIDMNFSYIWIRDMCIKRSSDYISEGFAKINLDALTKALDMNAKYSSKKDDFEKIYGKIDDWYNMTHFLLKCRFDVNWEREVAEDYTAFGRNKDIMFTKLSSKYNIVFEDLYVLPYIEYINQKDFSISLKSLCMTTHLKCIWKLKQ